MPKKNKRTSTAADSLRILRGGKAPPRDALERCMTDMQQKRAAQLERVIATERQMGKHLDLVQSSFVNLKDPRVARSLDGLLGMHQRLAKQRLAIPKTPRGLTSLLPGRISVGVVPPFDFDHVLFGSGTGSNIAAREAQADRRTGQISVSAISSPAGEGGGSAYGVVGLYFHPMAAGRLTVRATPTYSYQWWTNSIRPTARVRSSGNLALTIYAVDAYADTTGEVGTILDTASANIFNWSEEQTSEVRFDFKFDLQTPAVVSIDVTHTLVYYLFIEAQAGVHSVGWKPGAPGSIAGSKLSLAVPSIAYDYEVQPVLQQ